MENDTTVLWKMVSSIELLSLLKNTMDETVVQRITVMLGFSQLLSSKTTLPASNKAIYLNIIQQKSLETAFDTRAIQQAIQVFLANKPLPVRKHGTKEILSLEQLPAISSCPTL
jgi:Asp-tRNA(Asn)/Glu-tRNA(Gln) amidotransferase B subunit